MAGRRRLPAPALANTRESTKMRANVSVGERRESCQVSSCPQEASVLASSAFLWGSGLELELRLCPGHAGPVVAELELGVLEELVVDDDQVEDVA